MTELLYLFDSYLKEFVAEISAIDENNTVIYLNKTAFYPGGGGQPADDGFIQYKDKTYSIAKIGKNQQGGIFHQLEKSISAKIGEKIKGIINWEKRYTFMKYHSALHILCGLIWKEFSSNVTGGQIEIDKARMDFNLADFSQERVNYIEKRVNEEINASHEIKISVLPRDEAFKIPDLIRTKINLLPPQIKKVRIVEIVDLDLQADGGTHVRNTKEIGQVNIIETINKGKENKRIVLKLV